MPRGQAMGARLTVGGLSTAGGSRAVAQCTSSVNTASMHGGGGLETAAASPTVTNCTFSNNSSLEGGAMQVSNDSIGVFTNCIFWGDSATYYKEIANNSAPAPTVTFSCIDGGHGGNGNISENPKFVDPDNDNYALQGTSPCVNFGTSEGAPAEDILGIPRPQQDLYDMGAYEYATKK